MCDKENRTVEVPETGDMLWDHWNTKMLVAAGTISRGCKARHTGSKKCNGCNFNFSKSKKPSCMFLGKNDRTPRDWEPALIAIEQAGNDSEGWHEFGPMGPFPPIGATVVIKSPPEQMTAPRLEVVCEDTVWVEGDQWLLAIPAGGK